MGADLSKGFADLSQSLFLSLFRGPLSPVPRRGEESEVAADLPLGAPKSALRPESDLAVKLFGWPDADMSPTNCVKQKFGTEPFMQVAAGARAVDFTLRAARGAAFSLGAALDEGRPVMVASGARSCPHCMAFAAEMEAVAKAYGDRVRFVCVASMQPHPAAPEVCFETGEVWAMPAGISAGVGQPRTVDARADEAAWLQAKLPSWTVVADDLADGRVNPFWSTYGPAPRGAWLIDVSGTVVHAQLWWEPDRTAAALDRHLARRRG